MTQRRLHTSRRRCSHSQLAVAVGRAMLLAVGAPGRAFAHRDFRMLFGVNIFEFCGVTLFKLAALQWLYEATSSALVLGGLGVVTLFAQIPSTLYGGVLADAVDRVSAISSEKSRAVKLTLGAGVLKLSASSPEHGLAEEEIEVDYNGDGLEIGFNAAYLLDITRQIEGDTASLAMADAASPTVLRETADDSALFVLMPMRV